MAASQVVLFMVLIQFGNIENKSLGCKTWLVCWLSGSDLWGTADSVIVGGLLRGACDRNRNDKALRRCQKLR